MMKHQISVLGNDEKQYSIEDFISSNVGNPIGVVVQNEIMGVVLSLVEWKARWSNDEDNELLTEKQNECVALQTLSGKGLTARIAAKQRENGSTEDTAALLCDNFVNGDMKWYLPCLAELSMIAAYKDEINEVISKLSCGDALDDEWYWSSSENSQNYAWNVLFSNGYYYNWGNKDGANRVRACAAFSPLANRCERPSGASEKVSVLADKTTELTDEQLVDMLRKRGFNGNITKTINI